MKPLLWFSEEGNLYLRCPFELKDKVAKVIPGARWEPNKKIWIYSPSENVLNAIEGFIDSDIIEVVGGPDAFLDFRIKKENMKDLIDDMDLSNIELPVKSTPYQHQKKGFVLCTRLNGAALFCEMGTGKTLIAIGAMGYRFNQGKISRALIVAPLSVLPVWRRQIAEHAAFPYNLHILEGKSGDKVKTINEWKDAPDVLNIIVANYDSVRKDEITKALSNWKPGMIICDESHRIKAITSKQTRAVIEIAKGSAYRIAMTGTPICQGVQDLFSQYRFLDPTIFGYKWRPFADHYLEYGGYQDKQIIGPREDHIKELNRKMDSIAFRATKAECLDLPPEVDEEIFCSKDTAYLKAEAEFISIKEALLDEISELRFGGASDSVVEEKIQDLGQIGLESALKLHQISGGYLPQHDDVKNIIGYSHVSLTKEKLLADVLEDISGSVVIFYYFRPEGMAIKQISEKLGRRCEILSGDTPTKNRGPLVNRFQSGDIDTIAVQVQAGGIGIDLYKASIGIFYSMSYSYADHDQCRARLHRIGQQADRVTYLYLLTEDSIDVRILDAVRNKQSISKLVLDDYREIAKKIRKRGASSE